MGRRTNETRRLAPRFPRRASKKPRCGRKAPGLKMGTKRPLASAESQPCKISIARLTLLWHGRHGTKGKCVTAEPGVQSYYDQVRTLRPCNPYGNRVRTAECLRPREITVCFLRREGTLANRTLPCS